MSRYRGLDGQPWPEQLPCDVPHPDGLASVESWETLDRLARSHSGGEWFDAVIVTTVPTVDTIPSAAGLLGYDVGYFESEDSCFSSLFNELRQDLPGFPPFRELLNASHLFASGDDAQRYAELREWLRTKGYEGKELEWDRCYPFAIYGSMLRGRATRPGSSRPRPRRLPRSRRRLR